MRVVVGPRRAMPGSPAPATSAPPRGSPAPRRAPAGRRDRAMRVSGAGTRGALLFPGCFPFRALPLRPVHFPACGRPSPCAPPAAGSPWPPSTPAACQGQQGRACSAILNLLAEPAMPWQTALAPGCCYVPAHAGCCTRRPPTHPTGSLSALRSLRAPRRVTPPALRGCDPGSTGSDRPAASSGSPLAAAPWPAAAPPAGTLGSLRQREADGAGLR